MADKGVHYRLILVDDEDEVRGRISSKISEESGFRVVGTAGNGHDALELIEETSPHVVITDIRMPYVDGIKLAGIIKREYPTIRVAFITGYDEFDYAREAIELGVRSYLTKPLTREEISRFLVVLKKELDDEFLQNSKLAQMQKSYSENLPLIIDNYFSSYLSNSVLGGGREIEALGDHGIRLDGKDMFLALIRVEYNDAKEDVFDREKRKILIRSSFKDLLHRRGLECFHFFYHDDVVFLIIRSGGGFLQELDEALLEATQTASMYHDTTIDIGVSGEFKGFRGLRNAYLKALQALTDSKFLNIGHIAYYEHGRKVGSRFIVLDESDSKSLEYMIRFGTDQEIRNAVDRERAKFITGGERVSDFRLYMFNLVNIVINFCAVTGADLNEILGGDLFDTVARISDQNQMFDWFLSSVTQLRRVNLQIKAGNSNRLLENALAYIQSNFDDPDLNLERTCEDVGISVSYLSLLFKKNIGKTFVKYLTEIRLGKAKELLKYSGGRIIEIAEKCGYKDVYYFSHNFKKYVGMSPKNYRENQAGS